MPNIRKRAILECNHCKSRYADFIFTEIRVNADKTIDKKIFNDEINFFECPYCGNNGSVLYPVKVSEKESGEISVVIPIVSDAEEGDTDDDIPNGFTVIKVLGKQPFRVFYDFEDLKLHIARLEWGYTPPVIDPPPEERDIQEAIEKGILNEREADILKNADWDSIMTHFVELSDQDDDAPLPEDEEEAIELYMKFSGELAFSRKVVPIRA